MKALGHPLIVPNLFPLISTYSVRLVLIDLMHHLSQLHVVHADQSRQTDAFHKELKIRMRKGTHI